MSSSLSLPAARVGGDSSFTPNTQEATRVAEEFESVFSSLVLKEMRKTLEPGAMFGEDSGDVYGGLFDLYMGQQMSQSGGFGLAKMVRETLQRAEQAPDKQANGVTAKDVAPAIEG